MAPYLTNRDNPLRLSTNEIQGEWLEKQGKLICYFWFHAGPGELRVIADGKTDKYWGDFDVEFYDNDAKKLWGVELPADSSGQRRVGRFRYPEKQTVVMRIVVGTGYRARVAFKLRLEGAADLPGAK